MTEQITVEVPDDVAQELAELDDSRMNEVLTNALRDALGLAQGAEERRDELKEQLGLSGRTSEELASEPENAVEAKQKQLREKIREGR